MIKLASNKRNLPLMAESSPLLDEFTEKNTSLQDVLSSSEDLFCDITATSPLSPDSIDDTLDPVLATNLDSKDPAECTLPTDTCMEEQLDPRIKGELDTMNASGDDINNLEAQLLRIKNDLNKIMTEGNIKLDEMKTRIGDRTIENAKIYYTTLIKAKKVHRSLLKATHDFDHANKDRQTAKDELKRVEEEFLTNKEDIQRKSSRENDIVTKQQSASLERLNSAISRVNDLDEIVLKRENLHQQKSADFTRLVSTLQECKKKHRRNILKSKPYFETKYHYEHRLRDLMATRRFIFEQLKQAKVRYNIAMHNLETISLQIHSVRGDLPEFDTNLGNPLLLDGEGSIGSSSLGIAEIDPSIANGYSISSLHSIDDMGEQIIEEVKQIVITPEPRRKSKTSYNGKIAYL